MNRISRPEVGRLIMQARLHIENGDAESAKACSLTALAMMEYCKWTQEMI